MDTMVQLQRQLVDYTASLFQEGFLNDQFTQLQQLQDETNPDFVSEVVSLFFEDSERLLNELARALIGAERVQNVCISFRNCCDEQNIEGCLRCLQQVKQEYALVKSKLESLLKLEQQLSAAGGSIPI
ncbi:histidine-containing phosphotransfer protein 1-like isoform X2 [Malania oleifera]|uniref:histidine-containing phosphotransfer protein 1-like isoform X2 n=1 Tax=Malania oleifera TaxID=397392 RepID=UPI0025ADB74F|nr:histidine-containing phosphotransfer protein 1-like isoform X2 [Malania oleifera]